VSWELGPVVETTAQYQMRVARRHGVAASYFTGDAQVLADALQLRGAGPPWLGVLDSGEGWLATELDLSADLDCIMAVYAGAGATALAGPVVSAAATVAAAAVQAGRTVRCIRFDWRGGLHLRPVRPSGSALSEPLLQLTPGERAGHPTWGEARVAVFLMRWLEEHLPALFREHRAAEAWVEQPAASALEEAIIADPTDEGAWRVLADALLEQGHPRGVLMSLQMAGAEATATRNHLRKHPWLLPLGGRSTSLYLERGFVARLHYDATTPDDLPGLAQLLAHPALRFLGAIQCPLRARDLTPVIDTLEAVGHRAVRQVVLPLVKSTDRYAERLRRSFPRLGAVVSRP
jgi:uncharacterized protein (TIGR02996 family)